ncbi:MAG: hypothetical protein R3C05_05540 [Pirellulaceae bacterium]
MTARTDYGMPATDESMYAYFDRAESYRIRRDAEYYVELNPDRVWHRWCGTKRDAARVLRWHAIHVVDRATNAVNRQSVAADWVDR